MSDEDPLKEDSRGKFTEIPMSTMKSSLIGNFPVAGGHYMRFLPESFLKMAIQKFNKAGFPAVFYVHPRDLDPVTPRVASAY